MKKSVPGLDQFLHDFPRMRVAPILNGAITLKGIFDFKADFKGAGEISDSYSIKINIPQNFPNDIPEVTETNDKIPRNGKFHINRSNDTLCLGSPMRLLKQLSLTPSLTGFAEKCLVPYLYAVSHKLKNGGDFLFGELEHGVKGVVDDYLSLLRLDTKEQVVWALTLLGEKRRIANKEKCPCECGLRLGRCRFRKKLIKFRALASRHWYKAQAASIYKDRVVSA